MTGKALRLGTGAIVSFPRKFIHPRSLRDETYPDRTQGERLDNATVVRQARKKINHEPTNCVIVHHDDFVDPDGNYHEIWCAESHVKVEEEGDPKLFFGEEKDSESEEQGSEKLEKTEQDAEDGSLKSDEEKKPAVPMATVREVFSFCKTPRARFYLAVGLFASCLSGLVQPLLIVIFSESFTIFSNGIDVSGLRMFVLLFVGLGVYAGLTITIQATFLETAAAEMSDALKQQWFDALLRQDMAYYDLMDTSGTATIISTNGAKFKRGLGRKLGDGIQAFITVIGCFGLAFWGSWQLSLILIATVPVMAIATGVVVKLNETKTARESESYADAGGLVFSTVSSIRTILSLNAVESVIAKFEDATQKAYLGAAGQVLYVGLANGFLMASFLFAYMPLALYGSYLLYKQVGATGCDPTGVIEANETCPTTPSDVVLAVFGIMTGGGMLQMFSGAIDTFVGARAACYPALVAIFRKTRRNGEDEKVSMKIERKTKSLQRRSTLTPLPSYSIDISSPDGVKPEEVVGDIEFNDVSFRYPTRTGVDVYDGLNLSIKAGTTVAICGPSGGGKSTLIQLLERFYDPTSGSITLDGIDLRDLNVKWLRMQIGLVSQEPKLFALSIIDNIRIGRPDATMEEIEDAARKANAHDFIKSFPDGYDTMVGDEGSQLSGGQKQRISIARALIMKPKIILLDEATSALDSESEVIVQEALDKLIEDGGGNRTIIVIAHRLSTIKNADMIAVLSGGKVVETGKHAELISKSGTYYGLIEAQKGTKRESSNEAADPTKSIEPEESSGALGSSTVPIETSTVSDENDDLISFHDVEFTYPSRLDHKIFRGLDMSVKKGETLAIVGPSGQGKSTVIQLIEQFYRPDKGQVHYDGTPMTELNVAWLRDQMSLVAQEPVLYDISVQDNIRFGLEDATQADIERVAKEANCHDFITAFPDGYDTIVGSAATSQVSGGQKQRIAIARALLRNPKLLLLDEATSALDSESEQVVQAALDNITSDNNRTVVQIAHRLSTIRNSDRIIVLNDGKVRENGSHDELMALKGHYYRLVKLQSLDDDDDRKPYAKSLKATQLTDSLVESTKDKSKKISSEGASGEEEKNPVIEKSNVKKARALAKGDGFFFFIGGIGAILAGLIFPGWGFSFALLMELLYFNPVFPCDVTAGVLPPPPFTNSTCEEYWYDVRDGMQTLSFQISYILVGLMVVVMIGNGLLYYGFGIATERMNKRVRDASFKSLMRQEVAYFDTRPVSVITAQLSDDAALLHSFSGEPIRTLLMNVASLLVGLVVSFVYMWPFALVACAAVPFLAIGAEAEQNMYFGEDIDTGEDEKKSGIIVVESLSNIRTVASLTLEETLAEQYRVALRQEDPVPLRSNFVKGVMTGIGPFFQEAAIGLLFWTGGELLANHPTLYTSRGYFLSLFTLLFAVSGTAAAAQGATDRPKALLAAQRTFDLIERRSEIDPLSQEGKKDI